MAKATRESLRSKLQAEAAAGAKSNSTKEARRRKQEARAAAAAEQAERFRRVIQIMHVDRVVDHRFLAPDLFAQGTDESTRTDWFDQFLGELVEGFARPERRDAGFIPGQEPGYGSRDLAIWQGPRLIAVVRRGPDGLPHVTRFDG